MKRREFITIFGGATVALPLAVRAQQVAKKPIIGLLGSTTPSVESHRVAGFVQRLGELGWIEGRNIVIEYRWAAGRNERYGEIAAEFARLGVDVIVTQGTAAIIAAKQGPGRRKRCGECWQAARSSRGQSTGTDAVVHGTRAARLGNPVELRWDDIELSVSTKRNAQARRAPVSVRSAHC
jgi:hypothetical protein